MTLTHPFVPPNDLVGKDTTHLLYGGCSLVTNSDSWASLMQHAMCHDNVDTPTLSHLVASFEKVFKQLAQFSEPCLADTTKRSELLNVIRTLLQSIDSDSQPKVAIDSDKLRDVLFTLLIIKGGYDLKGDEDWLFYSSTTAIALQKCMKLRSLGFPLNMLDKHMVELFTGKMVKDEPTSRPTPVVHTPSVSPPDAAFSLALQKIAMLEQQFAHSNAALVPRTVGATHEYPDEFMDAASTRPADLVNFAFDNAPTAALPGELNIFGCPTQEQKSHEKTAQGVPVVTLNLNSGIKFVRDIHERYHRWHVSELIPTLLIYIQNCLAGTMLAKGYRSFLCHPKVLAADVQTKYKWFFCSLIDFFAKSSFSHTVSGLYATTPKSVGTTLSAYLMAIHNNYQLSRFRDVSDDDLKKIVVPHFFNTLTEDEMQKIRETFKDIDYRNSYQLLRSELERTNLKVMPTLKANSLQQTHPNTGDKRKRKELGPDPTCTPHSCDTSCTTCTSWVHLIFDFTGFCLRCFNKGHSMNYCFRPIAMGSQRCLCGKLNFGEHAASHRHCTELLRKTECYACGLKGHKASVCPSPEDVRRSYLQRKNRA